MMTDDARLQRWLTTHRDAVAKHPSAEHFDVDTLARHAAGQLSANKARMVNEHILACDDGRCGAFVRSQAADVEVASELLYTTSAGTSGFGSGVPGVSQPMHERTFQSREIIWSTFESMARELDIPIDELVNEAMAAYAKVRGYPKEAPNAQPPHFEPHRDPLEETHDAPAISALDRSYSPPAAAARAPAPAAGRGYDAPADDYDDDLAKTAARAAFPRGARDLREPGEETRTAPRFAALSRPINAVAPPQPPRGGVPPSVSHRQPGARASTAPIGPPPLPPRLMPPTTMPMMGAPGQRGGERGVGDPNVGTKRLVLTYQGRAYNVEKERYLLGRSKTQADLRLDDPNVSRQHAVIERVGAAWYIVDLGSTNGVMVSGERVARRALQDGDVIIITSHEIRCALR